MARDSIELTQYDDLVPKGRSNRSTNSELKLRAPANSRIDIDNEDRAQQRTAVPRNRRDSRSKSEDPDDSELLINREDLDLEDVDGEEAQFFRTQKRVPVRRSPIPRKAASQLKIAGALAAV